MPRKVTTTELRRNIYRLLDEVLSSHVPLEIVRKGKRLLLLPADRGARLERLEPHPETIMGDAEDLVHMDWSTEWQGEG